MTNKLVGEGYFGDVMQLILMKMGGQIIYSGMLGHHSSKLIEYFEVCFAAS